MPLPTTFLIGARRSGTTTLAAALAAHPQIFVSVPKEVHFFVRRRDGSLPPWLDPTARRIVPQDLQEYERLFILARPAQLRIDCSTSYLEDSRAADRIAQVVPGARILCILRQPVEQAWSIFATWHGGVLPPQAVPKFVAALERPPMQFPLAMHGLYASHLMPYYVAFGAESINVLMYQDLVERPTTMLRELLKWLKIDSSIQLPIARHNASGQPVVPGLHRLMWGSSSTKRLLRRSLPQRVVRQLVRWHHAIWRRNVRPSTKLPDSLVLELTDRYYADDIRKLEQLIGRDLSAWRGPHGLDGMTTDSAFEDARKR